MASALDIFKRSLRMIGQLGPGRSPGTSETADGLLVLNQMLDGWNTDPLKIYTTRIDLYNLQTGKYTYTIGPSGDFNTTRPERIERANVVIGGNLRRPIQLIDDAQWSQIRLPQLTGGAIPDRLYNDGAYPLATLYLWPGPNSAYQLELYTWQQLAQFANINDTIVAPPGYLDAMAYNLAVRLGLEWSKGVPPDVAALARETLAAIESANAPSPVLACDPAIMPRRGSGFNYLIGE